MEARIADRYVVLSDIGAGGMGVIVRARDERLGREVAIKVLPQSAIGDEHARRRLMREARAAAGLEHPGIVHVYDVGETPEGGAFLVMELVKGKSLRDHCLAGTLSIPKRLAALVDVGRALSFAHEQGFVHRDIKPDNVMIRDDGRAVVLDFGLAKSANEEGITVTVKGSFVGTPAYMAPEQARGGEVDASVDQFALAVTVFEALTGELPWKGESAIEIVSDILQGMPRCMRDLRPELPLALDDVIARALEKEPRDRFPTMTAFADALEEASDSLGEPTKASISKLAHAATVAAPVAVTTGSSAKAASVSASVGPATSPPRSSLRWLAIGGLAVAGAVGAGLGIRSSKQPEPPRPHVLADASSVLACPMFKATVDDFPGDDLGWLGASAAQLACERAQIVLGSSMRTKGPPELLGLSRMPSKDFPAKPYEGDARERSVAQAANANAWIDGALEFHGTMFHADLSLRTKDGAVIAHGQGDAPYLVAAIRKAMEPLAIPAARTPFVDKWYGDASLATILLFHDLEADIIAENPAAIREDCDALAPRSDLGTMSTIAKSTCAVQLFEPLPAPVAIDSTSLQSLATTASALRFQSREANRKNLESAAHAIESRLGEADSPDGRALAAASAAEIWYALGDSDEGRRLALVAVEVSPKVVDLRGTPWHRLAFTSTDERVLYSHAAWVPWEPFGQANVTRSSIRDGASLEGSHRAALLARGGYWLEEYGHALILNGDLLKAGSVAAVVGDPTIDVELTAAQGNVGKALAMAIDRLQKMPASAATSRKATYLALGSAELSMLLERPAEAIDDFVTRFVEVDPPVLTHGVVPLFNTLGACLLSTKPIATRCLARVRAMYASGWFGAAFGPIGMVLDGADAYAAGDWKNAAAQWRTMFLTSIFTTEPLRDVVTTAFERANELDLAEKSDQPALDPQRPMTLAVVRAAERAAKRGDIAKAKELAQRVVDKWSAADVRPPCVDRMRKILAK